MAAILRLGVLAAMAFSLASHAGCARQPTVEEEGGSPDHAAAVATLEPRHGGRMVELSGEFDAELVVSESGMCYVYLYDSGGEPVPFEGKEVRLFLATPDGKSEVIALEGMGAGAGAHFMNPVSEEMLAHLGAQGRYTANLEVMTPDGTQTGQTEVSLAGP